MPVTCPHCSTRYTLPEALLGPGGARVRCPRCREPFSVGPGGGEVVPLPARVAISAPANGTAATVSARAAMPARHEHAAYAGPHAIPAPAPPELGEARVVAAAPEPAPLPAVSAPHELLVETPAAIARAVLDHLDSHSGEAIAASSASGRLFREFGDVIAEAFEFYRRRAGSDADPAPFRAALRERWGVDLEPGHPARRLS